jgi:hypothetical protein
MSYCSWKLSYYRKEHDGDGSTGNETAYFSHSIILIYTATLHGLHVCELPASTAGGDKSVVVAHADKTI